jgi:TetR/AcrR family transcriptional regulator, cholesterol catabolism regulator
LPPAPRQESRRPGSNGRSSRSKRGEIIAVATEQFGRHGYEHTKWADVASAVGVGSTALYHYFESKLHCLYEIQAEAVQANSEAFDRITSEHEDFGEALTAVLDDAFDLTELEVLRNRVLVAEQSLVGLQRKSPREEEARRLTRSRMRDLEFAWATFLTRGMTQGAIPESDPRLLARAILGLCNSVWHWYRPRGSLSLDEVRQFYVARSLAVAGLRPVAQQQTKRSTPSRRARRAA